MSTARLELSKVATVLADYVDEEIIPKATGFAKLGLGIAGGALAKKGAQTFDAYAQTIKMLGLMDEHGLLIDDIRDFALEAMQKSGGKTEAFGIIFNAEDINKLHNIAGRYATNYE